MASESTRRGTTTEGSEELPRYRKQAAAHKAVQKALADGTLQQETCELCGSEITEAHHDDYDYPLGIRWLCRREHRLVHGALNVNRPPDPPLDLGPTISARTLRETIEQITKPALVMRLVDGEWVKLGLFIPVRWARAQEVE
jgi:hypothetical protein